MDAAIDEIRREAAAWRGLSLLMLHGSRARGTGRADSDWDFAYLAGPDFDADECRARLVELTHSDRIDLAFPHAI